ncbi:MAG: hypothetical protein MR654_06175 [Corynebacterium glucuronolyticum]|nr:hypothetical protein [Corynebacterium glucuronolyticum]
MNVGDYLILARGLSSRQRQQSNLDEATRLARGVYINSKTYWRFQHWDQYKARCLALGIEGRVLLGKAAATLWGFPTINLKRADIPIIGNGAQRQGVSKKRVPKTDLRVINVDGFNVTVTSAALTVIDIARWNSLGEAVRAGDMAVAYNYTTKAELRDALHIRSRTIGIDRARTAVRLINHLSESPRESDVKVNLFANGFEPPYQQAVIRDSAGVEFARVDFFYPEQSIVIEYDGQAKTHGINAIHAVNNEITRHRRLESEGLLLIRVDNDSWQRKLYLKELARQWDLRGPFPRDQWSAPGLAWEP